MFWILFKGSALREWEGLTCVGGVINNVILVVSDGLLVQHKYAFNHRAPVCFFSPCLR